MRHAEWMSRMSAITADVKRRSESPMSQDALDQLTELAREAQRLNSITVEPDLRVALQRCVQPWRHISWTPATGPRLAEKTFRDGR